MIKNLLALTILSCGIALAAPVLADNDPSMQQVYDTAKAGHLAQAQQMIEQVLRDHPRSAKAHFVAAELDAKQGNLAAARGELNLAEQIDPGLPFAKPESVEALKAELGAGRARAPALAPERALAPQALAPVGETRAIPWGTILLLIAVIAVVLMVLRRRSVAMQYPGQYPGGMPVGTPAGPYGYGGGPGAVPMSGGGIGSSIAGGLASGLAVGAGVVAGEELAHHFLDGERHEGAGSAPQAPSEPASNADMGGSDFGVNEPDSWDDSSSGSGGGGDDWS